VSAEPFGPQAGVATVGAMTYPDDPFPLAESSARQIRMREVPASILKPREKIGRFGVKRTSNAELLAVLLGSGIKGHNVVRMAENLLARHGVAGLPRLALSEWTDHPGIGTVKACQMLAAFELGRRLLAPPPEEPRIGSPADAFALVKDLRLARKEQLISLYLDAQNHLIVRETVSVGSLNTTRTHPREVMQPAVLHSALAFILVHNHPSGSLEPSRDDLEFTRSMARAGELMGINLYDHLIVSRRGYVSLRERGLM
jgi:DNA repair protein RadC